MKTIIGKPGSGKTAELIKHSIEKGVYIVCSNPYLVSKIAEKLGLRDQLLFPLSYNEFVNRCYCGQNIKGFAVDDADLLIQYISDSRVPITAITMTEEKDV